MRQQHYERLKTHCPKGHEYNTINTRTTKEGKRVCRECDRERKRMISARNVAGAEQQEAPEPGEDSGASEWADTGESQRDDDT